jgi:hypothetical protein
MATLGSLAKLIRSKNAGPWMLTIDVMFPDAQTYRRVVAADVITPDFVSRTFGVDAATLKIFHYDPANAIKVSFPRRYPNGHPLDTDVFGGQQFAPLVGLHVPDATD